MIKKNIDKANSRGGPDQPVFESLEIPSQGSKLLRARRFVEKLAAECGYNKSDIFDLKVSVGEACANAIEHGSPGGKRNTIKVNFEYKDNCAVIEVSDEGVFKPRFPALDTQLNYRGRGIPFMLALMDEVEIKESERGTTVRLVKIKS